MFLIKGTPSKKAQLAAKNKGGQTTAEAVEEKEEGELVMMH
jgi:hypothetical protein